MKAIFKPMASVLVLSAAGALATTAHAGCTWPQGADAAPNDQAGYLPVAFKSVAWMGASSASQDEDTNGMDGEDFGHRAGNASIVGFWKITFTAQGNAEIPDDTVIDQGYATWHSDGTELMNSSRAPITGSFCMGVWKQVRHSTFKLNHFALSWDPSGTTFIGPTNIRELVTVDRSGNHYSGTFTIDQFAEDGSTLLAHVAGKVSATRITAD